MPDVDVPELDDVPDLLWLDLPLDDFPPDCLPWLDFDDVPVPLPPVPVVCFLAPLAAFEEVLFFTGAPAAATLDGVVLGALATWVVPAPGGRVPISLS